MEEMTATKSRGSLPLPTQDRSGRDMRRIYLSLLALLAIMAGSFWVALNPEWVLMWGRWGYLGAALFSFFASATVILPAPGLLVIASMSGALNPWVLGIVAGIGSGLGELSGYVAGASGRALISGEKVHPLLHRFTTRYTVAALFVLAILPLPIFDFAGILAGAMRMRIVVFLGAVIPGKIIKHVLVALAGAGFLPMLRTFFGI
jgi:membrane protein YqaA with SNARE-associated domain